MPLYEYECPRTDKRFEVIQKFSDDPITKCDDCDEYADCEGECRKILSAPAIQFKGAGWYVTDYAGKGKEKESGSEKSSKSGDSGSSGDSGGSGGSGDSKKSEKKESSTPKKDSSSSKSDS